MAQLGEHLVRNEGVVGSNPIVSTRYLKQLLYQKILQPENKIIQDAALDKKEYSFISLFLSFFCRRIFLSLILSFSSSVVISISSQRTCA